jgi:putative SOS response-associated peptidase YedK
MLPIIRTHRPNIIELATWGFWPEGWKRSKRIHPQINARLEPAPVQQLKSNASDNRA